jgi:type II secretory pathway pseudopilin PulG
MNGDREQGFTFIELLILVAVIGTNAAGVAPGLLRAQTNGNETSAIASLKTTTTAQVAYKLTCGNGGYAATFIALGAGLNGGQGFPADLGSVVAPQKDGYNFMLGPGAGSAAGPHDCNGRATITEYYAAAVPMTNGTTGTRSFAVNARNILWQLPGGVPPREPFGAPATTVQ